MGAIIDYYLKEKPKEQIKLEIHNAQGGLVRIIRDGAFSAAAIGGNGTVGGYALIGSQKRAVLWRDGTIVDPLSAVASGFGLRGISDDERTLVGTEANRPAQYFCS